MTWLYAFLLTAAIELPIVALLAGRGKRRRGATDSIGANLVTHPIAWFLVRSMEAPWLVVEIGVFVTVFSTMLAIFYAFVGRASR